MSDYDTLPLNISANAVLPNNGAFTVYEWAVPSLISGNQTEWMRMASALVGAAMERVGGQKSELFSDMMALQSLAGKGVFRSEMAVVGADPKFGHGLMNDNVCSIARGKIAAHFSHYSIDLLKQKVARRTTVAASAIEGWADECGVGKTGAERMAAAVRRREFVQCLLNHNVTCCQILS